MDRCTKFKMFNLLILFCVVNFFIYRIFTGSNSLTFSKTSPSSMSMRHLTRDSNATRLATDTATSLSSTLRDAVPGVNTTDVSNSTGKASSETSAQVVHAVVNTSSQVNFKGNGSNPVLTEVLKDLPLCPLVPPNLNGALATYSNAISFEEIGKLNNGLRPGGLYSPPDCKSRHRVAIIIPYRNREHHLQILLNNLHPMLRRQQLEYGIYVVDQALPGQFNRAMLMNIGYKEAMARHDYQCAIFHDVDLIPENDRNIYSCPENPRHLSASIDKFHYKLPYAKIFGGASALKKEDFEKLNGFSNLYFGWGGEDDDMAMRLGSAGLKITRYPMEIARYKMIKHTAEKNNQKNPKRFTLLRNVKSRMPTDGLNSLKYEVQKVEELPSHTRLQVYIDEADYTKS